MKERFLLTSSMIGEITISGKGNVVCRIGAWENVIVPKQIFNIVSRSGMVRGIIIELPPREQHPAIPKDTNSVPYKYFKVG